jgi:hypothetical protein
MPLAVIGPAAALVAGGNRRHAAFIFNELTEFQRT